MTVINGVVRLLPAPLGALLPWTRKATPPVAGAPRTTPAQPAFAAWTCPQVLAQRRPRPPLARWRAEQQQQRTRQRQARSLCRWQAQEHALTWASDLRSSRIACAGRLDGCKNGLRGCSCASATDTHHGLVAVGP